MKTAWFGVKSVYQLTATGEPKAKDKAYSEGATMVEDRVVLISARDFAHALKLGLKEAKAYAKQGFKNPYGQKVVISVLGLDAFLINDQLGESCEVFSSTEIMKKPLSKAKILDNRLGADPATNDVAQRRKFSNAALAD